MACALSAGYTRDCKDSIGGLVEGYFIEFGNVTAITLTSSVVTGITQVAQSVWRKYEFVRDAASATETFNASVADGTGFWQQELTFSLNKLQTATRNEILLLAQNLLVFIGKDANGKFWLYGASRGLDMTGGVAQTGAAAGERNGYSDLLFAGQEKNLAIEVSSTYMGTIPV
jgi:hypothetical protein